jgi:hypothetical protein
VYISIEKYINICFGCLLVEAHGHDEKRDISTLSNRMGFVHGEVPRWGIFKIRGSKLVDICGYWPTYFQALDWICFNYFNSRR